MFKIIVFSPIDAKEKVKQAMFEAGAGKLGAYDHCAFETLGTGQFRPLSGARPTLGATNELTFVDEARIEMLCDPDSLKKVVKALKAAHPYEEPAYDIIQTLGPDEYI